jgi:hypothetical protein
MSDPYRPLVVDAEAAIAAEGPRERWHVRIDHCLRRAAAEADPHRRDQWLLIVGLLRMGWF